MSQTNVRERSRRPFPIRYVNVVSLDNHAGLSRHIAILLRVFRDAGFCVAANAVHRSPIHRGLHKVAKLVREYPFDVNLFVENVHSYALPYSRINCLIPNQEWLRDESLPYLTEIDRILCQTRHAHRIFVERGCDAVFTSFTSLDRLIPGRDPDYRRFFHLAGNSLQKGTSTVVDLWSRHPEWPPIKIVQNPDHRQNVCAPNIEYVVAHVDDEVLKRDQNDYGIHVCPSEAEGFGHTIVEAMSCRAVVITTDGAPMNEIVTPDRGLLAAHRSVERQRLGFRYCVDPRALEERVIEAIELSRDAKRRLGENARRWYEQNDEYFRRRIVEVIEGLL